VLICPAVTQKHVLLQVGTQRRIVVAEETTCVDGLARSMIAHWQSYRARPATLISGWTDILTGHAPRTLRAYLEECVNSARIG
jgi:hypothetical protein